MKKKLKWIILTVLVLLLAVGSYALYIFKFKEYDVADDKVDEIVEEGYEIQLPDGQVLKLDKDGNVIETIPAPDATTNGQTETDGTTNDAEAAAGSESGTETGTNNGSTTDTSSNTNTGTKTPTNSTTPTTNEVTVAAIKDKYRLSFQGLESQANAKLSGLIDVAKNEYLAKRASGESISVSYFYQKYTGAAANLESTTDAAFNALYNALTQELKANGFNESYAQSFKQEYEASKEARKSSLLEQVRSAL